uniref:Snake toxin/toxin-like domain-containing protein n=1 Tax=Sinocyclocheilus grahami TaxID=75366 RepID=A0A672PPE0_SINGR
MDLGSNKDISFVFLRIVLLTIRFISENLQNLTYQFIIKIISTVNKLFFPPESFMFLCGISANVKLKHCVSDCVNGSMNVGIVRTSSVCCDTDLCNVHDAPDPNSLAPNGKKCYSCDGQSCSNILRCTGSEDHCITSFEGQLMVLKDVQSASCCEGNLCNSAESITQSFLFLCGSLLSFILLH